MVGVVVLDDASVLLRSGSLIRRSAVSKHQDFVCDFLLQIQCRKTKWKIGKSLSKVMAVGGVISVDMYLHLC